MCGTPVPAGGMVAVVPYLIYRNPGRLAEPADFDPARFLSPAPGRHRYAWIPFGGGKRGCVGAGFARQEAVLVLARLCRHHRLDLVGPGMPRPRGFVTLRLAYRSAWPQPPRLTVGSSRLTVPWQLLTLRTAYQQRGFAPPYHQEDMDLGGTWL